MKRLQRGVVLLIALIALVAMSLAGIALMRSVDTGLVIAGNLAFKQATTQMADAGTEQAIEWIAANPLDDDEPAAGYYATWMSACDLSGGRTQSRNDDIQWDPADEIQQDPNDEVPPCGMKAAAVASADLLDGYEASYVINRMCDRAGTPNGVAPDGKPVYCSAFQDASGGGSNSTKQGASYGQIPLSGTNQQYYRITTRVVGPRNTSGIVQTIIAF